MISHEVVEAASVADDAAVVLSVVASEPAVVVGAAVILFDPIFQGLAISLMAGEVASLLLSRMTVPIVYFMMRSREPSRATPRDASTLEASVEPMPTVG